MEETKCPRRSLKIKAKKKKKSNPKYCPGANSLEVWHVLYGESPDSESGTLTIVLADTIGYGCNNS